MEATIIIDHPVLKPIPEGVKIVRIKGHKRIYGEITYLGSENNEDTFSIKLVYNPSPKSKLKNKSIFSKVKMKIYGN